MWSLYTCLLVTLSQLSLTSSADLVILPKEINALAEGLSQTIDLRFLNCTDDERAGDTRNVTLELSAGKNQKHSILSWLGDCSTLRKSL